MDEVPVRFDGFDGLECPHCGEDTFAFVVAPMDERAEMQIWITKRGARDEFVDMIEQEFGVSLTEYGAEEREDGEDPERLGLTL